MASRELILPPFSGIRVAIAGRISLSQAAEQKVVAWGNDRLIAVLELAVRHDIWDIAFARDTRAHEALEFEISLPRINYLGILGSADIVGTGATVVVGELDLVIQGSGGLNLNLNGQHVRTKISGNGSIELTGRAEELSAAISGSGDLRAFGLASNRADLRVSGSGNVEVVVLDRLSGRITGSGDIYYVGDPIVDVRSTGSGRVVRAS